jgi:phosphoglycolate phosphatase
MAERIMPGARALFFDLDGTLTDPAEGITRCYAYALAKLGRAAPGQAALEPFIGPPLREVFRELLETEDTDLIEAAVGHYRERFAAAGMFENRAYPGVKALLEALIVKEFTLFVATSKPEVFARRILEHFEIARFFCEIAGPLPDGSGDDKALLLKAMLERHSLQSGQCLMIGDRKHDVLAAHAAGMKSVGVTYGFGSESELRGAGADYICDSIAALEGLLCAMPAL